MHFSFTLILALLAIFKWRKDVMEDWGRRCQWLKE